MKFDINFVLATLLAVTTATALPEAEALPEPQDVSAAAAPKEKTFGSCAKWQFGQYRCRPNGPQSTIQQCGYVNAVPQALAWRQIGACWGNTHCEFIGQSPYCVNNGPF